MRLDSARSLKQELRERVETDLRVAAVPQRKAGALTGHRLSSAIGFGITGAANDYRLAVRVFRDHPRVRRLLEWIERQACSEIDLRIVGPVTTQENSLRRRSRPVFPGLSVAHPRATAGTLGGFVVQPGRERILLLSNNHVLANENDATPGDPVLQPAPADGGSPADRIAVLDELVPLAWVGNAVDAAVAALDPGLSADPRIRGTEVLSARRLGVLTRGEPVYKVGRTTGSTRGRIGAFELDLPVLFGRGELGFENQIEIVSKSATFSLGGDSGSLVYDRTWAVVGLLYAGNGLDTSYANPIGAVLSALNLRLLTLDSRSTMVPL